MRLLRHPKYRRRVSLVVANSLNSLLVPVFGIVVSLLVVRLASVGLWGAFVDVMIWVQLGAMVVGWGNKEYLLRAFSRQPAQIAQLWQSSLVTRLVLFLPVALGLALLGWPAGRCQLALVWLLALVVVQSHDVVVVYRRSFVFAVMVELAATALTAGAVLARRAGLTVDGLVAIFALAAIVRAISYTLWFRRDVWRGIRLRTLAGSWQPAGLRLAFPFFVLGFTGMLQSRIDLYSVNYFLTPHDVGVYQVFINLLLYVQAVAAFILTPFLKGFFRLSYGAIGRTSVRLFLLGVLITVPAMLVIYFLLTTLYQVTLSPMFYVLGALYVLPIYYYLPIIYGLYKAERQTTVLAVNLCGLTANLALNALLLPRIGLIGAILAAAFVRWCIFGFYLHTGRSLRGGHVVSSHAVS